MKKSQVIGILFLLLSASASQVIGIPAANTGTTAGSVLKLEVDTRGMGMGKVFGIVSQSMASSYSHPAGLAWFDNSVEYKKPYRVLSEFSYTDWLAGMKYSYVAAAVGLGELGRIAFHNVCLISGEIERADAQGNTIGKFDASSVVAAVTWSKYLLKNVAVGINVKYLHEMVDTSFAPGMGVDIEGLLQTSDNCHFWSAALRNLGIMGYTVSGVKFTPAELRVGYTYIKKDVGYGKLVTVSEAVLASDNMPLFGLGFEYVFRNTMSLRVGYQYKLGGNDVQSSITGLTLGTGAVFAGRVLFNYAYVPYGWLGEVHRISLGLRF
ncbi:MAG: PorV/PorQ family protein [Elusimicrobiota bacterium]